MTDSNKTLCIAVGCENGKVPRKHFGDCPEFHVYKVHADGTYQFIAAKQNLSPEEKQHADPNKLKGVLGELSGCEVVVSGLLSPNFIRMRDTKPVQPVVTHIADVDALMRAIASAFDQLFNLVTARQRGERPQTIPVLE